LLTAIIAGRGIDFGYPNVLPSRSWYGFDFQIQVGFDIHRRIILFTRKGSSVQNRYSVAKNTL
jgi:hypothetical protein